MKDNELAFQWLAHGIEMGYCSRPYCQTHDMPPLDEIEVALVADYL